MGGDDGQRVKPKPILNMFNFEFFIFSLFYVLICIALWTVHKVYLTSKSNGKKIVALENKLDVFYSMDNTPIDDVVLEAAARGEDRIV